MTEIIRKKNYDFGKIIPAIPGLTQKIEFDGKNFNPVQEPEISISAGFGHTLILIDGDMYGCGDNSAKQLKSEEIETFLNFTLLSRGEIDDDEKIISVKAAGHFSVALIETGEIFVWGTVSRNLPVFLYPTMIAMPEGIRIAEIDCGNFHIIAGTSDGRICTWGENEFSSLGFEGQSDFSLNVLDLPESIQVCAKDNRSGSLGADGIIRIWGEEIEGIEEIHEIDQENPVIIAGIVFGNKELFVISEQAIHIFNIETGDFIRRNTEFPLISVTAGNNFFIYLVENKEGFTALISKRNNPTHITGFDEYSTVNIGSNTIRQVSGKYLHCVAVDSEGRIFTWGYGGRGRLGTGNENTQNLPVQVYLP